MTHIPFTSTKKILGTPLFASNNALLGKGNKNGVNFLVEISRRDDIESMVYILIYFLKGTLPWKGELTLDFLKQEIAKNMILKWRDPNGPLCYNIERK